MFSGSTYGDEADDDEEVSFFFKRDFNKQDLCVCLCVCLCIYGVRYEVLYDINRVSQESSGRPGRP